MPKRPKVLCIDDQVENLRVRAILREQFGCEVIQGWFARFRVPFIQFLEPQHVNHVQHHLLEIAQA